MTNKYRVLIVDDNEINAMLASELIEAFGLESVVADSGAKAIGLVRENEFSCILMDHIMPGMNGIEATGIIHGMSSVPICAMTGDLTEKIAAEFTAAGAVGAISKPLKPRELYKFIQESIPEGGYTITDDMFRIVNSTAPVTDDTPAETGKVTLRAYMNTVTGLDFDKGVGNALGSEDKYFRLLKAASGNMRQYVRILSEYLATADPEQLQLASHSLKTVFANIGLESLRGESEQIEKKAGELVAAAQAEGSIASFDEEHQEKINEYISHTMNAALEVEDAIAGYEQATRIGEGSGDYETVEEGLNEEDFTKTVEYTSDAFARYEIDYILEGLGILRKATCKEERIKIEAAMEAANNFAYDTATELFEEFKKLREESSEQ